MHIRTDLFEADKLTATYNELDGFCWITFKGDNICQLTMFFDNKEMGKRIAYEWNSTRYAGFPSNSESSNDSPSTEREKEEQDDTQTGKDGVSEGDEGRQREMEKEWGELWQEEREQEEYYDAML